MERNFPLIPERLLMGPGPSNVPKRVLEAMSKPLLGHLDPDFLGLMSEIQEFSRRVFQTQNRLTIPVSGTGSAGMEAAVVNFVGPGDSILVGVHGVFGARIADCARRAGGNCTEVRATFGEPLSEEALAEAAERCRPKIMAVVHAETSTGVLQPLEPIRAIADRYDSLLLVDAVTSLGGHPVSVDEKGIDICYSGTQKCLNCPPGLAPLTISPRAEKRMLEQCQSWYLDLKMVRSYWGQERSYHHTAPISMNYALREALAIVLEEGLERRWERHRTHHLALVEGIEALGLQMHVRAGFRLWSLNTIRIPDGVDDAAVRKRLLREFNLEIGGGLGELKGKVWRVGLMGVNSQAAPLLYFLYALESCLTSEGHRCEPGAGVKAAGAFLKQAAGVEQQAAV